MGGQQGASFTEKAGFEIKTKGLSLLDRYLTAIYNNGGTYGDKRSDK